MSEKAELPALVPIDRTAKHLDVDPKTVRRWIRDGRLTAVRVGPRLIRVHRESIENLMRPVGGAR